MTFVAPQMLFFLFLLPVLAVAWRFFEKRRQRRLAQFVDPANWPLLNGEASARRRSLKAFFLLMALGFGIIAAARPAWGTRERMVAESGIDLVVALDVSQSMLAVDDPRRLGRFDVSATRRNAAKSRLRQITTSLAGHRVALVPFAGDAFLQCPLTADYGIFMDILTATSPDSVGMLGTDIGRAIEVAREAFAEGGTGSKVLLIVTDGEDHAGNAMEQARLAAREGIRIYAIGIGSQTGGQIVLPDGRIKTDAEGARVNSKVDTRLLQEITDVAGGLTYYSESGAALDTGPLIGELDALERGEYSQEMRVIREERYQIPLALALLCLLADGLVTERVRRKKPYRQVLGEAVT
jgi:Ca-activated chloride channel family protein